MPTKNAGIQGYHNSVAGISTPLYQLGYMVGLQLQQSRTVLFLSWYFLLLLITLSARKNAALNNPLSAPKTSKLDPAPTFLVQELIQLIDDFLYFLTVLSDSLLLEEYLHVPVSQKASIILPGLKNDGLDKCDPANYCPHCKCNFLSNFLEHIVGSLLIAYLDANESITSVGFPTLQIQLVTSIALLPMVRLPFLRCWM